MTENTGLRPIYYTKGADMESLGSKTATEVALEQIKEGRTWSIENIIKHRTEYQAALKSMFTGIYGNHKE